MDLDERDQYIDLGVSILQAQVAKLNSLRKAGPEVADALAYVHSVWSGDRGWTWLLRYNAVLEAAPVDLLARGEVAAVRTLLVRIEHGIAV